MRALIYVEPGVLEWQERPAPRIEEARDALVRPLAVARCDLDVGIVTGLTNWQGPFGLGHEMVGEVVAVGDAVTHVVPGERVIVPFQISCGSCSRCLAGQTACCETVPFRSSFGMAPLSGVDYGGALSDLLKVPFADHMLVPLPDAVSLAAAAGLADNVVDGYASVAPLLARMPGARVLVVGGLAQSVGLYAALAAKALGAEDVVYYDDDAERLALAARLGVTAQEADPERRDAPGGPFPIVVDASATAAGLSIALHSADLNGICHRCYGDFSRTTEVPLALMYNKGLTLHISRVDARARMPGALAHVCSGDLRPEELITTRAPFSEAAEAMLEPGIKLLLVAEGVDADG